MYVVLYENNNQYDVYVLLKVPIYIYICFYICVLFTYLGIISYRYNSTVARKYKYFKMSLSWIGISNIGKKVYVKDSSSDIDPAWLTPSGIFYRNGYSCNRSYYDESKNLTYDITNSIFKSTSEKPMFKSIVTVNGEIKFDYINSNPTNVYRKVVEALNIPLKGKLVGQRFFGMMTAEYKEAIKNVGETIGTEIVPQDSTNIFCDPVHQRQCSFKCVLNYGEPCDNVAYEKVIGHIYIATWI